MILVNETYPSDCIIYRALINPDQPQYHVDGYKAAQVSSEPATVSSSDKSLVLKPDKGVLGRGPQTPSRAESEQSSLRQHLKEAEARAFEEKQQQIAKQAESKRCHDALDDAIAQIMTLKDLVRLLLDFSCRRLARFKSASLLCSRKCSFFDYPYH